MSFSARPQGGPGESGQDLGVVAMPRPSRTTGLALVVTIRIVPLCGEDQRTTSTSCRLCLVGGGQRHLLQQRVPQVDLHRAVPRRLGDQQRHPQRRAGALLRPGALAPGQRGGVEEGALVAPLGPARGVPRDLEAVDRPGEHRPRGGRVDVAERVGGPHREDVGAAGDAAQQLGRRARAALVPAVERARVVVDRVVGGEAQLGEVVAQEHPGLAGDRGLRVRAVVGRRRSGRVDGPGVRRVGAGAGGAGGVHGEGVVARGEAGVRLAAGGGPGRRLPGAVREGARVGGGGQPALEGHPGRLGDRGAALGPGEGEGRGGQRRRVRGVVGDLGVRARGQRRQRAAAVRGLRGRADGGHRRQPEGRARHDAGREPPSGPA